MDASAILSLEIAWTPVVAVVAVGAGLLGWLKVAEWRAQKRAETHTRALLSQHGRAECEADLTR